MYQADTVEIFLTIQVPFPLPIGIRPPEPTFVPIHGAWHSDCLVCRLITVIKMPPVGPGALVHVQMSTGSIFEMRLTVPMAGIVIATIIEVIGVTLNENVFLESVIHLSVSVWTICTGPPHAFFKVLTFNLRRDRRLTNIKAYCPSPVPAVEVIKLIKICVEVEITVGREDVASIPVVHGPWPQFTCLIDVVKLPVSGTFLYA